MDTVNSRQAAFIYDKANRSAVNPDVCTIFIGDGNDLAFELDVVSVLEYNCIKWWNESNGCKYVITKDFVDEMYELSGNKPDVHYPGGDSMYTGMGSFLRDHKSL